MLFYTPVTIYLDCVYRVLRAIARKITELDVKSVLKFSAILFILVLTILAGQVQAALPVAVEGQPLPSLAPVLKEVTPSVVNVYTQTRVRVRSPLLDDPIFRRFFNVPEPPCLIGRIAQ